MDPRQLLARLSAQASDLTPEDVRLAWWLQQTSAAPGGLDGLVATLMGEFPERMQTRTMAKKPNPPGGGYDEWDTAECLDEMEADEYAMDILVWGYRDRRKRTYSNRLAWKCLSDDEGHNLPDALRAETRIAETLKLMCAETVKNKLAAHIHRTISATDKRLVKFGRRFVEKDIPTSEFISAFPFPPSPRYFQDLPDALRELCARQTAGWQTEQPGLHTTLRAACAALDWTLKTGCSAGMEAPAGSLPAGCSAGMEAPAGSLPAKSLEGWAAAHRGGAIVFPVPPSGTKDTFASALAARLGLPPSKDINGIRAMVPNILRRSGMALVLADAQNLLHYRYKGGSPGLVEWVVAFAHEGIPVALCVDPQFLPKVGDLAKRGKLAWQPFEEAFRQQWRQLETPAAVTETEAGTAPSCPTSREDEATIRMAGKLLPDVGLEGWEKVCKFVTRQAEHWGGVMAALLAVEAAATAQARLAGRESAIYADLKPAFVSIFESTNAMESGRPKSAPAVIPIPRRGDAKAAALQPVAAIRAEATAASETLRPAVRQAPTGPRAALSLLEAGQSRLNGPLSTQSCSRRASRGGLLTDAETEPAAEIDTIATA